VASSWFLFTQLSEECLRTLGWYFRKQGLRKCCGEATFKDIALHIDFNEKSVGSRVLQGRAESERMDLINVSCDGETGVNCAKWASVQGEWLMEYHFPLEQGTTQEEFVTYEIWAYCSHVKAREFVSDVTDVT